MCHKCGSPTHIAVKCPKIHKPTETTPTQQHNDTPPKNPTITQKDRLQKLYNKYKPAGVRSKPKTPKDTNAKSYAEMAKNNKGKAKEQNNTETLKETVDHSKHNPNTNSANSNTQLEKKLDLIINKLDAMQTSINNLNERTTKLEEWKQSFMTTTQSSEITNTVTPPNKIIDVTASSSQKANLKRVRVSQSSSKSDSPRTPSPVNTLRFTLSKSSTNKVKLLMINKPN